MSTEPDPRREAADKTHPGFAITCGECGSETVIVDSDVGMSYTSGTWGGVYLKCQDCGKKEEIWSA